MELPDHRACDNEKIGKVFLLVFTLSIIYSAGILLTGRLYIDDLGRSLYGYTAWGYDGRPLSDFIMSALNFGTPILDLSPLYQILSMAVLSFSLAVFGRKYFPERGVIVSAFALFLLIATPFYIENISYKYDSLPMALSLSAIILPFSLRFSKIQFVAFVIGIVCSLSLYQASLTLFLILSAIDLTFTLISEPKEKKPILLLKKSVHYTFALSLSYVIYKIAILREFSENGYAHQHSGLISFNENFIDSFTLNINKIFDWFFIPLYKSAEIVFIFYAILILISIAIISARAYKSNYLKLLCFSCVTILVLLSFFASFIHISLLKEPVFATRVLISFTGFVLFSSFLIVSAFKNRNTSLVLLFPFFVMAMIFSYSYANASKEQDKLDGLLASRIQSDVYRSKQEFKYVSIKGVMPSAEKRSLVSYRFPIMNSLIPIYMNGDWSWGAMLLKHYGLNMETRSFTELKQAEDICSSAPLWETKEYLLYGLGDTLLISFDKDLCK